MVAASVLGVAAHENKVTADHAELERPDFEIRFQSLLLYMHMGGPPMGGWKRRPGGRGTPMPL